MKHDTLIICAVMVACTIIIASRFETKANGPKYHIPSLARPEDTSEEIARLVKDLKPLTPEELAQSEKEKEQLLKRSRRHVEDIAKMKEGGWKPEIVQQIQEQYERDQEEQFNKR